VEGRHAFARTGGAYLALIGREPLREGPEGPDELVQEGSLAYWICELGRAVDWEGRGGFAGFRAAILARRIEWKGRRLLYEGEKRLELEYRGEFRVDGRLVDTEYPRLDSPWGGAPRKMECLELRAGGQHLSLDFSACIRDFG
jgi:hypothetical protein